MFEVLALLVKSSFFLAG